MVLSTLSLLVLGLSSLLGGTLAFSSTPTTSRGAVTPTITTIDPRIIFPRWSLGTTADRVVSPSTSPISTPASSSPYVMALFATTNESPNWNQQSDDYAAAGIDPNETIARRIVVTGDVDGGYYRSCVKNEASRFRKLIGTMSPPNSGDNARRAEIYVEGKRKMVDGFVRWCKRGDVGLSQAVVVESVMDEFPTGLYDEFYVHTGR